MKTNENCPKLLTNKDRVRLTNRQKDRKQGTKKNRQKQTDQQFFVNYVTKTTNHKPMT